MFIARVIFGKCPRGKDRDDLLYLALSHLADLVHHGQIDGDYFLDWCEGALMGYVDMPRPDAFERRHLSSHGRRSLEKVRRAFGSAPRWSLLSDRSRRKFPTWRSASFFYLRSATLDHERSPLNRGDDGASVPTYLLPLEESEIERIYFWSRSYRCHDDIWLDSAELELPAYEQMATPDSELSAEGRRLCRSIERATGIPTYYYLFKYHARKGDGDRLCPGCGRKWRLPAEGLSRSKDIQFLCKRCRLVSEEGIELTSARLARIGEYRGRPRRKG